LLLSLILSALEASIETINGAFEDLTPETAEVRLAGDQGVIKVANDSGHDRRWDALQLAYQQACTSYGEITDFRGKLLALLPLATGTGAFLLLDRGSDIAALGAIGVFGVVVTLGLFMYELRGIQRCHRLEDQAGALEYELGLDLRTGPFRGQPRRSLCGMLGPPGAGLVVYLAVMFAWLYVAGVGYGWWPEPEVGLGIAWLLVPGYLVVLAVAWVAVRSWWPGRWRP
jgi:hypothetical protein